MTKVAYKRLSQAPVSMGGRVRLPVRDPDAQWYAAETDVANCVFRPAYQGDCKELRIPDIASREQGGMSDLLDGMVRDLEISRLRFVNVDAEQEDGMPRFLEVMAEMTGMDPPDVRPLHEALHGAERVTEDWTETESDFDGEADCLVVDWSPEDY